MSLVTKIPLRLFRSLRLPGLGIGAKTITANYAITDYDEHFLAINASTGARDIALPSEPLGRFYVIKNSGSTYNIVLKEGVTTIQTLRPGDVGIVVGAAAYSSVLIVRANSADQVFLSTEVTATGSAQNTAHGLGVVPSLCIAIPTAGHNGSGSIGTQMPQFTYGTHTSTNAIFTAEAGAQYRVVAFR